MLIGQRAFPEEIPEALEVKEIKRAQIDIII